MSDPINWYQSQRSPMDLWFGPVDPTLPTPWKSVTDDSTDLVFYWNPETNVSNNQISPYELDMGLDLTVHTSPKISLKSVRAKQKLAGVSHVRMKRKTPSVSFSQRRYRNPLILSFYATPSFLSVRSSQAQEPSSPMHMGARMPIALQRRRGAETVALGDPTPSGQVLLHKKKMMTVLGHKWGRQVQGLKPFFHFRQRRAKWKLMYTGRLSRQSNKDIHNSDVVTLVGDQPWVLLSNLQSNVVKVFDGMPKRSIKIVGAVFNTMLTEINIDIYYGLHDARYIGQVYSVQVIAYKVLAVATLVALVTVKDVVQTGNFDSADRLSSHPRSIYGGWSLYIKNKLMVVVASHYQAIVNVTDLSVCISFAIFDKQGCFVAPISCINVAPYIARFFIDGFANWSNISDNLWSTIGLRLVLVTSRDTRLVCHISRYKSMVVAAAKKLEHYYDITLSSSSSLFKIVMHKFSQDPMWHACQHELNHGFIIGGHISFILSHNEEVMPLLPTSLLGFSMDFTSMILWCGMRSLAVINDAPNFFMVNSHLDHAKLLQALIGIKLLDENWQEKSEATLGNTTVTGTVFPINACRILTLPHVKRTLPPASWDWVMKFCIRDDFVGSHFHVIRSMQFWDHLHEARSAQLIGKNLLWFRAHVLVPPLTWWQGQSLNSKLIPHTSEIPTAKYLGRVERTRNVYDASLQRSSSSKTEGQEEAGLALEATVAAMEKETANFKPQEATILAADEAVEMFS
ncbi:hypothetical protein D8674_010233 [Pyrus ussuriensis x Pyrus communis]|uniref:Uncharacterized protein n=1 Tax=Pyrus ussuriensis x Pyrus communis TaxID=2448454 RepID=A0A5N5FFF0_9ROSA|nr:hypothetical protein D8674_010233 [Pyrus ussuriensis x Pyrus communis]